MRRKHRTAVAAIIAVAALVAVQAAGAHTTDSLHKHGWDTTIMFDPIIQCGKPAFAGTNGYVRFSPPNVVTSALSRDGKAQPVVFAAELQYYNFQLARWITPKDQSGHVLAKYDLGTYYTFATPSGNALSGWRSASTGFPVTGMIGMNDAVPGYYYRVHVLYLWMDGQAHVDDTAYCPV